ncbi:hypothetical protein KY290_031318 [Solanum tuberosum]|uniref:Zinc finger BED domain-containing protein RICESLEEPER 2-like n=1 Tax=Solanum tuberosum TaxID=4113 RepID=A0ABQ7U8Z7_SOLTU|nr:hypothetical protein KY290_031318 [Solanum tuberosum]
MLYIRAGQKYRKTEIPNRTELFRFRYFGISVFGSVFVQPAAAQPATAGDQQATTSSSRRPAGDNQQPPVPSTSSSSRQSRRPAAHTTVATASHQSQSTSRAQAVAAPRTAAVGDRQATTISFQMAEQNQSNVGVANQSRISMADSTDNTPTTSNDASIGTEETKKRKEMDPRDWVLHKRILNFCPITSYKGEHLAECISNCLLDWNLDNVFIVTVDNASSNDVAILELSKKLDMWETNMMEGKHLHVRCMAHILNLIVQDGLKEIGPSIKRVRQMVKYVRSSSTSTRNFLKCVEMQKIECDKMLSLDVPTRWNSTYLMLDTTEKFEKAFERFDLYDDNFNSFLATDVCEDGSIAGSIQYEDWANVRNITKFLEKFYDLTLKVSGSRYVTCNVHFEDICELDAYLKVCMTSDDVDLSKMASGMKEKFKKYWGTPEKMNKMLFIASVLDPRNKFMYVSFALEELLGEEKGQIVNNEVNAYLKNLFAIYVSKYAKGSKNQSSSSDSSDSSTYGLSQNVKNSLRTKFYMKKQKEDSGSLGVKSKLDRYLLEDQESESEDFDILIWWKVNSSRFPTLSQLARDVLAIPMSSVASECAFSTGGRILDPFRSSLTPKCVQCLICVQDWLRQETKPICVEESLEFLEKIELEMANSGRNSSIVDL